MAIELSLSGQFLNSGRKSIFLAAHAHCAEKLRSFCTHHLYIPVFHLLSHLWLMDGRIYGQNPISSSTMPILSKLQSLWTRRGKVEAPVIMVLYSPIASWTSLMMTYTSLTDEVHVNAEQKYRKPSQF